MQTAKSLMPFSCFGQRAGISLVTGFSLMLLGCSNGAGSRDIGSEVSGTAVNSEVTDAAKSDDTYVKDSGTSDIQDNSASLVAETESASASADTSVETTVAAKPDAAIAPPIEVAQLEGVPVDLDVGLTYAEARTRLLQQGWIPDEQPDPGPYGVERTMYDVGFTEVSGCAGTGLGQCRFEFYHPDRMASGEDNVLSVITYGGSRPEVANWNLQSVADASSDSADPEIAIVQSTIPVQFQGLWDANVAGCSNPGSDGRLRVEADRLQFYESSGPVTEVIMQGDLDATVYLELSGEGMTWTDINKLELSGDRNALTITSDGFESVRYRCPDA